MANIIELGKSSQGLDVRFNQAFPPMVPSASSATYLGPFYQGCGSPERPCEPSPLPASVAAMRVATRGGALGSIVDAYLGDVTLSDGTVVETSWVQSPIFRVIAMLSVGVSVYHGYKRNNGSIGWALGWGLLGAFFPVITPAVALAQGLGQRKKA